MKILTTSTNSQTIKFIPRLYSSSATLILRDDTTNVSTTTDVTLTQSGDYLNLAHTFTLVEGRFYDLELNADGDIWGFNTNQWQVETQTWDSDELSSLIYKDKIFCTDQDVNQTQNKYYSVNKNEYTTNDTHDNDYIVL
tara:strand:+ start:759 stop:1175 length:417 start_codon:yes stop_codon:yes gene_type:complete